MEAREALIAAALRAQNRIMQRIMAETETDWLTLDITFTQLKTLIVLIRDDGISLHGLADILKLGRPATSMLVDHLVRAGLVERDEDPTDRRRSQLHLSPDGRELVRRLRLGREDRLRDLLYQLTDEDLSALERGLQALAHIAEVS